jgi:hypothetical protein
MIVAFRLASSFIVWMIMAFKKMVNPMRLRQAQEKQKKRGNGQSGAPTEC